MMSSSRILSLTILPLRRTSLCDMNTCWPNLSHSFHALDHSALAFSPKVAGMPVGAHLLQAGGISGLGVGRHRAERDVVGSALPLRCRVDVIDPDIVARVPN